MSSGSTVKPGLLASIALGGGAAVITCNFTHPIELVKVRMQMSGGGVGSTLSGILKTEGALSLWKGIQAAWGRESFYASIKVGGYGPIRDALGASAPDAPFLLKFAAGAASGSLGSCVGKPWDVMKTMMQANQGESVSLMSLARKLHADQGVAGFYRGIEANIARACVLNGTKMAVYDAAKGYVSGGTGWTRKDPRTIFCSATISGFCMTCTVSPFDMLRTRLMNQPTDKKLYNGFVDAAVKIMKNEGPGAFYRGFFPIWARFAPTATLQLLIFEQMLSMSGYKAL
jgi:hypothetical protein